jgi:hypothetical protein
MYHDDIDELAYLWTKIQFIKKCMNKNKNSSTGMWLAELNEQTKS